MPQITNTAAVMTDPAGPRLLAFLTASERLGDEAALDSMEARGVRELAASDLLPAELLKGVPADFEALGIALGEIDPDDEIFRRGTVPAGWTRRIPGASRTLVYLVDQLGRDRVQLSYQATYYKRSARMALISVRGYLEACQREQREVVTDSPGTGAVWAGKADVAAAARELASERAEELAYWRARVAEQNTGAWPAAELPKIAAEQAWFAALAGRFGAVDA